MKKIIKLLIFSLIFICAKSEDTIDNEESSPENVISQKYSKPKKFDYYVCGNDDNANSLVPDCTCSNNHLICESKSIFSRNRESDYYDSDDRYITVEFKSFNIKILDDNFDAKNVTFENNHVPIIKKDKILSETAYAVENLALIENGIFKIENGSFDNFSSLKILNLKSNKLMNISDAVLTEQLGTTLIELNLINNLFRSVAAINFQNLINLEILLLSNQYLNVHENITSVFPVALSKLKVLELNNCNITAFNEEIFANLTSLQKLYLYRNPLTSFPHAINALSNLKYLNLDRTEISYLNNTVSLKVNPNFEKLILTESYLKYIGDCAFCSFPNLKTIHLWKNHQLRFIHENAFGFAKNGTSPMLDSFSVEYCKLSTIPQKLLYWQNVTAIGIEGNPFFCNCSMAWLINDLASPSDSLNLKEIIPLDYRGRNEMKCSGPHAFRDIPLIHISGKFCLNKKDSPAAAKEEKETPAPTKEEEEEDYYNFSTYLIFTFAIIASFALGFAAFPVFRYCIRLKKQKSLFLYKEDDKIMEDFDDGTNISNV